MSNRTYLVPSDMGTVDASLPFDAAMSFDSSAQFNPGGLVRCWRVPAESRVVEVPA